MSAATEEDPVPDVKTVEILDLPYSRLSLEDATETMLSWAEERAGPTRFVAATGFHGMSCALADPGYRSVLRSTDLLCADGIAPVLLSKLAGHSLPERVPGPDLMQAVLAGASDRGLSSYLLGDTERTLSELRDVLETRYPGHEVAGMYSPPFRPQSAEERSETVGRINASGADFLWVALGTPKQERWIHEQRDRLEISVATGVGAAFRFLAGRTTRAPGWVGAIGLEWLWRLATEPRRLWKRSLVDAPRFLARAVPLILRNRFG